MGFYIFLYIFIGFGLIRGKHCYYMEHDLELIIARLEILEIGVCNIIYNPGNIGKRIFLISHILEILEI